MRDGLRALAVVGAVLVGLGSLLIAAAPTAGASGSPIVVGGVWSAATYAGADIGAEAAFDAFNAAGGLNGRKIKFIGMQEDGQSQTGDVNAAKALVNDHVVAVVPVVTEAWQAGSVLAKAGIPYFGWGISTGWWDSNNGFSFGGAVPPDPHDYPSISSTSAVFCKALGGTARARQLHWWASKRFFT